MSRALYSFALSTILGLEVVACGRKPETAPAPTPAISTTTEDTAAAAADRERVRREAEAAERDRRERDLARARATLQAVIFFDFDRSDIRFDARPIMDAKAVILRAHPSIRMHIDGHADERGSSEYNLALGMRRAASAKQYLVRLDVDPSRIEIRSFGEERPADPRHTREAWDKNRRAEFEITQVP